MNTEPIRFEPILKTVVWGGEKIAAYKGLETDLKKVGESWELSGVKGDESVVASGEYAGATIAELAERFRGELLGEHVWNRTGAEFPLLIKFIDAHSDLSVQVHPDDKLAAERHGSKGKTEMWYVMDSADDAHLISGLSKRISKEELESMAKDGRISEALQGYHVSEGDVFYLPAGRIHAIGSGCFVAEIQQTSNITYRIYDYGRLGLDGKPRQLHVEESKDAVDFNVRSDYRTHYIKEQDCENVLVDCEYFTTSLYELSSPLIKDMSALDSFMVVICTEGSGTVNGTEIHQGMTLLIPACAKELSFVPDEGGMTLLTSHC